MSARYRGSGRRLRESLSRPLLVLVGALLWGALMAASAALSLHWAQWRDVEEVRLVAALYGFGGFVASPLALAAARVAVGDSGRDTAFAAHLLALSIGTIAVTAAIYGLQHRLYFAAWHADAFSIPWIFQFVFTVLGAVYQFAVVGVRLYFPIGLPALLVFALWRTAAMPR